MDFKFYTYILGRLFFNLFIYVKTSEELRFNIKILVRNIFKNPIFRDAHGKFNYAYANTFMENTKYIRV